MRANVSLSQEGDAVPVDRQWSDRSGSPLTLIPSWMTSLALHAALLFLFASRLESCGDGSMYQTDGELREVGIYVKEAADRQEDRPADEPPSESVVEPIFTPRPLSDSNPSVVPDEPPVDMLTPTDNRPNLGAGAVAPIAVSPHLLKLPPSTSGILQPKQASGLGPGETSFFDIRDNGIRFVYVLDSSGSMNNYNAFSAAKKELKSSLHVLDSKQQFQIVFYNESTDMLTLRGKQEAGMFWATQINKTQARQFIDGVRENLGTKHLLALKVALSLQPDVLFFLTDAGDPVLETADLYEIKKINNDRTRIHCVEFGRGGELNGDNFLKRLARENGGQYQYRDVTQFGRQ